jgi:hypothetical protein
MIYTEEEKKLIEKVKTMSDEEFREYVAEKLIELTRRTGMLYSLSISR